MAEITSATGLLHKQTWGIQVTFTSGTCTCIIVFLDYHILKREDKIEVTITFWLIVHRYRTTNEIFDCDWTLEQIISFCFDVDLDGV